MDAELQKLEEELRRFSPSQISGDVVSRMADAMDRWEDQPVESKVVPFPGDPGNKSNWSPMWAAAAAVAILGALGGLFLPGANEGEITAMRDLGPVPVMRQASFIPVGAPQRKVSSLDAGVISDHRGVPYQVIRVVRQDEANFKGETGNVGLKISRPKVEYYVVPVAY